MADWTFGSGGTYATGVAALTALKAAQNPLTSSHRVLCVGASTENSTFSFAGWDFGVYEIEITSDTDPGGDPTAGHLISADPGVNYWLWLANTVPGHSQRIKINKLKIKRTGVTGAGHNAAATIAIQSVGTAVSHYEIKENIIDGNSVEDSGISFSDGGTASGNTHKIIGNKIFAATYAGIYIIDWRTISQPLVENNTYYGQGTTGGGIRFTNAIANQVFILRNNAVSNCTADYLPGSNVGSVVRERNASEDATGDSGYTGFTPSDEFISLDSSNSDFLKLKRGSKLVVIPTQFTPGAEVLGQGGVAPDEFTTDIAGESIPNEDNYFPIGCHAQLYDLSMAMNVLDENLYIFGKHMDIMEENGELFNEEIFPDETDTLLEEYESVYNLSRAGLTTDERRNQIISAMRARGGLSKDYFETVGNAMGSGEYTVSIAEGSDAIGFMVHTSSPPATQLPGQLYDSPFVDNPYNITVTVTGVAAAPNLEALFNRLKPEWTAFNYTYVP